MTPRTPVAPGVPVIGIADGGDESAVIRWTAPASDGGSAIYGYEVQAIDPETGIVLAVDAAGPTATQLTMTGLTNDVPYAFWVRAVNAVGAGTESALSNVVTPTATATVPVPSAPGTSNPGTSDPGTSDPGTSDPGTSDPGISHPGTSTGAVTPNPTSGPTAPPRYSTVPGTPRIGDVSTGNGVAVVRWAAPIDNGRSPILRYEVEVRTASGTLHGIHPAPASTSRSTVDGLTNGAGYRFRVRAVNAIGGSAWSTVSATATPRTTPAAPATVSAEPGSPGGKATTTVSWKPGPTGGSPITGFRVTAQRLAASGATTGAPLVLTRPATARRETVAAPPGVRAGTRYRLTVQQINAVGIGPGRSVYTRVR